MKRINQELKFEDHIELRLAGDTYLSIEQSSHAVEEIEIDYDENHVAIHASENLVEVIDDTKKSINKEDLPNFTSAIHKKDGLLEILHGLISDALNIKRERATQKTKETKIKIRLLNNKIRTIKIRSENLSAHISNIEIGAIEINSGNIKILQDKEVSTQETRISSANMAGEIAYTSKSKNITIEAGNGKLGILKEPGFRGAFEIRGNNIKTTGNPGIESHQDGLFKITMNNGKIKIL